MELLLSILQSRAVWSVLGPSLDIIGAGFMAYGVLWNSVEFSSIARKVISAFITAAHVVLAVLAFGTPLGLIGAGAIELYRLFVSDNRGEQAAALFIVVLLFIYVAWVIVVILISPVFADRPQQGRVTPSPVLLELERLFPEVPRVFLKFLFVPAVVLGKRVILLYQKLRKRLDRQKVVVGLGYMMLCVGFTIQILLNLSIL